MKFNWMWRWFWFDIFFEVTALKQRAFCLSLVSYNSWHSIEDWERLPHLNAILYQLFTLISWRCLSQSIRMAHTTKAKSKVGFVMGMASTSIPMAPLSRANIGKTKDMDMENIEMGRERTFTRDFIVREGDMARVNSGWGVSMSTRVIFWKDKCMGKGFCILRVD